MPDGTSAPSPSTVVLWCHRPAVSGCTYGAELIDQHGRVPGVDGPTRPLGVRQPGDRPPSARQVDQADAAGGTGKPAGPRRDGRRQRRPRWVLILAASLVVVLVVWGIDRLVSGGTTAAAITPQCTVATAAGKFTMTPEQAANAATIAAIGHHLGLPDHAVTIALATALQESRLINLPGGDRDSVGLFQQRPSEGWGPPSRLRDPVYASRAFYNALTKLPGWESLAVTQAAQAVQHSAAPDAYAAQEAEARSLAIALTGEVPAGLVCHFHPAGAPVQATWSGALANEVGPVGPGAQVSAVNGWVLAGWLVAHAQSFGFTTVSFSGQTWTPASGAWRAGGVSDGTVHVD